MGRLGVEIAKTVEMADMANKADMANMAAITEVKNEKSNVLYYK